MGAIPNIHSTTHAGSLFHHGAKQKPHDPEMVTQAQRVVAQTFFGTLLKQMHSSPFKSELLDGGKGSEGFSSMLDQHLIDRMAGHSKMKKLVDAIAAKYEKKAAEANKRTPAKKTGSHRHLKHSGYMKPSVGNRSQYVPTSLRA
jgi:hypothetical protein